MVYKWEKGEDLLKRAKKQNRFEPMRTIEYAQIIKCVCVLCVSEVEDNTVELFNCGVAPPRAP